MQYDREFTVGYTVALLGSRGEGDSTKVSTSGQISTCGTFSSLDLHFRIHTQNTNFPQERSLKIHECSLVISYVAKTLPHKCLITGQPSVRESLTSSRTLLSELLEHHRYMVFI